MLCGMNMPLYMNVYINLSFAMMVLYAAAKAGSGGTQNGGCFTFDNQQRLLAEEAELDHMVKELQATLPPSEGQPDHLLVNVIAQLTLQKQR